MNIRQVFSRLRTPASETRRRRLISAPISRLESLEPRELLAADLEVLKNIAPGSTSGLPSTNLSDDYTAVAEFDGLVYFRANDGISGTEVWRTDGTAANTLLFADLRPGSGNSDPGSFFVANDRLYFQARGPTAYGLFVTDGTLAGTTQLSNSEVGQPIGVIGNTVYFYRSGHMTNNGAFWKSDGTSAGTVQFAVGYPESALVDPVIFDNTLIYSLFSDHQLWKIDTVTGVKTRIATVPEQVSGLTVFNGDLYFSGNDTFSGDPKNLWKLDSATSTPTLVQDPGSARIALDPKSLTPAEGTMYFIASPSTGEGRELWRTDGTSSGTVLVKDIKPSGSSVPFAPLLTVVGDSVYFAAEDGVHGLELWKSGGLDSNTTLVKDVIPGSGSSGPRNLFNLNGVVTFVARTAQSSERVLWTSDGTEAGTVPVSGEPFTLPNSLVALGNNLIFAAQNGTVGRELFIFRNGDRPQRPVITAPSGVVSSLRPTVSWNAVPGSADYEIWIRNVSTGENQVLLAQASGTSFTPSTDLGIGNFTVWVRTLGINGGPASFWSAPLNFRIKAPVTQVTVSANPQNGLSTISWQALPGAVKYDVWIDRMDVPTSEFYRNTNVTGSSVSPASLPRGSYRVWVRGLAADDADGAWSTGVQFTSHPIPAITIGLNPTFDTTPTVTWTSVAGASTYEVYVLSIHGNFKALHQKNINDTSFTWPTLPAGPYRYWVRATGATEWSNPVDIDTAGRTNVLGPIGNTTDRTPTISWRPVDGAVRYELWVNQLGVRDKIIYLTNLTGTSHTPASNLPTGNYRIWVRALGSSLTAPWSAPVDFTIAEASVPLSPSDESELLASVFTKPQLVLFADREKTEDPKSVIPAVPVEQQMPEPEYAVAPLWEVSNQILPARWKENTFV